MDEDKQLFSLQIDPLTKAYLTDIARWARFLSIVGMISILVMLVSGLAYSFWITSMFENMGREYGTAGDYSTTVGYGSAFSFIVIAIVGFFPLLYMFRFASRMRKSLAANDQENLNIAFQNLKIYFRYMGIITLIALAFFALWLVLFGIGSVMV